MGSLLPRTAIGLPHRHLEHAADVPVGVVGDQHTADRCRLFEPAGDVDGVAHHRQLATGSDRADQRRSGVDPDAHRQAPRRDGRGLEDRRLQREPGAHRTVGVELVGAVDAPHRHHRVAHVLVDVAVVVGDDRVEATPQAVHQLREDLGVECLGQRGEPEEIGEQDGDDPPALLATGRLELLAEGGDRGVDHLVIDQAAQRSPARQLPIRVGSAPPQANIIPGACSAHRPFSPPLFS